MYQNLPDNNFSNISRQNVLNKIVSNISRQKMAFGMKNFQTKVSQKICRQKGLRVCRQNGLKNLQTKISQKFRDKSIYVGQIFAIKVCNGENLGMALCVAQIVAQMQMRPIDDVIEITRENARKLYGV